MGDHLWSANQCYGTFDSPLDLHDDRSRSEGFQKQDQHCWKFHYFLLWFGLPDLLLLLTSSGKIEHADQ